MTTKEETYEEACAYYLSRFEDIAMTSLRITKPRHYPSTANSGIYDARAFRVGHSSTVHVPANFPDGNKVVARCGVYGWATERDSRIAAWANAHPDCQRCAR